MMDAETNRLFNEHLPLAQKLAKFKHAKLSSTVELGDVEIYAQTGLLDAIVKFSKDLGASFPHFAEKKINWAILDGLREDYSWLGRKHNDIKFHSESGFGSDDEAHSPFESLQSGEVDPAQQAEENDILKKRLRFLGAADRQLYYWWRRDQKNNKEIAELVGLTESRISQLIERMKSLLVSPQRQKKYIKYRKPFPQCGIKDCTKPHLTNGLCAAHFKQWHRVSCTLNFCPIPRIWIDFCTEPDCNNRTYARGLCSKHYPIKFPQKKLCSKAGCVNPVLAKGLCRKCWASNRSKLKPITFCTVPGCKNKERRHGMCLTHLQKKQLQPGQICTTVNCGELAVFYASGLCRGCHNRIFKSRTRVKCCKHAECKGDYFRKDMCWDHYIEYRNNSYIYGKCSLCEKGAWQRGLCYHHHCKRLTEIQKSRKEAQCLIQENSNCLTN
jgi:RNA polymerase sigma factor (sigma-70 family)